MSNYFHVLENILAPSIRRSCEILVGPHTIDLFMTGLSCRSNCSGLELDTL